MCWHALVNKDSSRSLVSAAKLSFTLEVTSWQWGNSSRPTLFFLTWESNLFQHVKTKKNWANIEPLLHGLMLEPQRQIKKWSHKMKTACKTHQSDSGSHKHCFILILSDNRRSIELTLEQKHFQFRRLNQRRPCVLFECNTSESTHLSRSYLDF